MKSQKQKIVAAMSGGVDSSVAAALLVDQGYEVTGMMLRLWSEAGTEAFNRCCTPESMGLARRVAAQLDIPFYVLDVRERFFEQVVSYFFEGYTDGVTPNPCLKCNQHIRFGYLLDQAISLGADALATGHYARTETGPDGKTQLHRGFDTHKDQSYILAALNQDQLSRSIFPIGDYPKTEVREIAREFNLPIAERSESQDLCFLAGEDYRTFLERHQPEIVNPGHIQTLSGESLGTHRGLAFYTIGQRKGLGLSSPEPLYVLEKNKISNTLVVGKRDELPRSRLEAREVNWVSGNTPQTGFHAHIKIRYSARLLPGWVNPAGPDGFSVEFDEPVRDITPGQAAVIYDGDQALGLGIIKSR